VYSPLVNRSVVLYGLELPIFLFDVEEACFVVAFGRSDGPLFHVLYYEFV
jgi:hypothetical protein